MGWMRSLNNIEAFRLENLFQLWGFFLIFASWKCPFLCLKLYYVWPSQYSHVPFITNKSCLALQNCCWACLWGYLCMRGRKITAIQSENVCPAWDDFGSLQQTPFHCEVQMSCNKKLCSSSWGAAVQMESSAERTLLYEQKQHFETLMIAAPIGVLLSLLARALAERCPILTWASHLDAVRRSVVTLPAAIRSSRR